MKSSDEDRCPVAPPPRSCLRCGPIRSRRVTFRQDRCLCEPAADLYLNTVTQPSQEVPGSAVQLLRDGGAHTWSDTWSDTWSGSLQSYGTSPRCVGVSGLSVVLGGLLQLVEQHWTGPGSLQRDQQFLGGAYDLLSELLQPAAGGGGAGLRPTSQGAELVLLRRRLERTEQLLERMKGKLLSTLKENYHLRHQLTSQQ